MTFPLTLLSDDTICTAGKLALYQSETTENNSIKQEGLVSLSPSVIWTHLSAVRAPQKICCWLGNSKAGRCIRGCHIKCECFPLSNLITDFYGGISQHTESELKDCNCHSFSQSNIWNIRGVIRALSNGLWTSEMQTHSDRLMSVHQGEFAPY